jgi:Flp pilus assembly protein TadD
MQYGKRALTLASTGEQKVLALMRIAEIYTENELYADARSLLSQALKIDDCDVRVIGNMAGCYAGEGNGQEAVRLAKRGLMLDPDDAVCKWYADQSPSSIGGTVFSWPP